MTKANEDFLFSSESVSEYLKREYFERLKRNANYSLRAFARDLDVSPSRISESVNANRNLSLSTVDKIAKQLKLTKRGVEAIRDLHLMQARKSPAIRDHAKKRLEESKSKSALRKLEADKFSVMTDWYHGAIVEMTELKTFKPDPEWIAKKLRITKAQAGSAIRRLFSLGILRDRGGRWTTQPEMLEIVSQVPSRSIREHHKQMLEKAYRSLSEVEVAKRDLSSMILAVPEDRMVEFREKIQSFMTEFWTDAKKFERSGLYALNIQFFPVSDPNV
jgi:uncharacterized protein (TIGR02147 family)